MPGRDDRALPAGDEEQPPTDLKAVYGENQRDWVYCWRCDMALTLEERESQPYDGQRGFYHRSCPKPGSAPTIPHAKRTERNEHFARHKTAIGAAATPVPYREW